MGLLSVAPGGQRASGCHISSSPPTPTPSILGWLCLQECDGISANRQSVPKGGGPAPRRPHSPSHSKHKGLSSLSAWLSSSRDSLPIGESLQGDKPGLLAGCPPGAAAELPWNGNLGAGLAWGLNTSSRGWGRRRVQDRGLAGCDRRMLPLK